MAHENPTGGNEQPSDGEPQNEETQAPVAESPGSGSTEPDWKRKYLEAKSAEEKANRLERELEETKRKLTSPAEHSATPQRKTVSDWANDGDTVAAATLAVAQQQILRDNLDEIDDTALRKAVRAKYATGKYGLDEFQNVMAEEKRVKDMADENAKLREQLKKHAKPQTNDVSTSERDTPDREPKTIMTAKQWDKEQASLSPLEAMKKQMLKNEGKIVINYD